MWDWAKKLADKAVTVHIVAAPDEFHDKKFHRMLVSGSFNRNRWNVRLLGRGSLRYYLAAPGRHITFSNDQIIDIVSRAYCQDKNLLPQQKEKKIDSFRATAKACGWREKKQAAPALPQAVNIARLSGAAKPLSPEAFGA